MVLSLLSVPLYIAGVPYLSATLLHLSTNSPEFLHSMIGPSIYTLLVNAPMVYFFKVVSSFR